ncbi:MAG: chromate efflux transporter [Rhodothermales bacterium]|nr:chromate efflux transporter [Rhodothermales bacterium]
MNEKEPENGNRLVELGRLFLKLGTVAFGGPAAHIAMLEDEVVSRRNWLSRQHFLDLIGATNLIPGPNSTEMTMHIGYERSGWPGVIVAGISFIFPAFLITGGLAFLYVKYGQLPEIEPFLAGIKPAVMAIILGALWKLGKAAIKSWDLVPVALAAAISLYLGVNEVVALVAGGLIGMVWLRLRRSGAPTVNTFLFPFLAFLGTSAGTALMQSIDREIPLWKIGGFFLKVGAILYGSGYVLFAFLEGDLIHDYGWLTSQELLDAIAVGQFTPGPILTTATFIGYLLGGVPGAIVATIGIFLPAFVFVGILNPLVPRLRQSLWAGAFLDAINACAVALMLVVTLRLGTAALVNLPSILVFGLASIAILKYRLNSVYIVLGGGIIGYLLKLIL